jgi:hypothetical protein
MAPPVFEVTPQASIVVVGMDLPVLLPQQLKGRVAIRGQLGLDARQVQQRPSEPKCLPFFGAEHLLPKKIVLVALWQRLSQSALLETEQVFVYRGSG